MGRLPARSTTRLESRIFVIRGQRVMVDADLAEVYSVSTKVLNQAVKRNARRFPGDFAFQLPIDEFANLRSQSVTSRSAWGGRRTPPWLFTEHGAIMAASVLNSRRAVEMSIFVVRAFIRLREFSTTHAQFAVKLAVLERRVGRHDKALAQVIAALRRLILVPPRPARQIGFHADAAAVHPRPRTRGSSARRP